MTGTQVAPGRGQDEADTLCAQCGAELADDQEWCLECGGARTLIHRGPDWRIPLALIAAVIVLAIGGFVVAVISLSNSSSAPAAAGVSTAAANPASSNPGGAATAAGASANISKWAVGLPGWTVVLAAERTRGAAYTVAKRLADQGIDVGVLDSSQHPSLKPGHWIVFSGRYATRAAAASASSQLVDLGQTYAHPRLVGRPGGP